MKQAIYLTFLSLISFYAISQESSNTNREGIREFLIENQKKVFEDQSESLLKEIERLNKEFEGKFNNSMDKILKDNEALLNQLENEYSNKLKEERDKIADLKKYIDDILKIKDSELKIADKNISEINKNLKELSSDEFIKNFKKDLKRQLEEFKLTSLKSFEEQLNIKLDTLNNEKK